MGKISSILAIIIMGSYFGSIKCIPGVGVDRKATEPETTTVFDNHITRFQITPRHGNLFPEWKDLQLLKYGRNSQAGHIKNSFDTLSAVYNTQLTGNNMMDDQIFQQFILKQKINKTGLVPANGFLHDIREKIKPSPQRLDYPLGNQYFNPGKQTLAVNPALEQSMGFGLSQIKKFSPTFLGPGKPNTQNDHKEGKLDKGGKPYKHFQTQGW